MCLCNFHFLKIMTQRTRTLFPILHGLLVLVVLSPAVLPAKEFVRSFQFKPDEVIPYKQVDGMELVMHVFYPDDAPPRTPAPAVVFFHGGGFTKGKPDVFFYACDYFTSRGMVAISVQYRLASSSSSRLNCLKDAKSAIRYVRQHADRLGIDPDKVVSAGGSAGGSLAGATATSTLINEETDDLSISAVPAAAVLFNPIGLNDSGKGRYSEELNRDFKPGSGVRPGLPPMVILIGDQDKFQDVASVKEFQQRMQQAGVTCTVHIYPGAKHSFFDNTREWVVTTLTHADEFLIKQGILTGKPSVEQWASAY
jgi:acetyl esterase/lipase